MGRFVILGLGIVTWLLCLPRLATLGVLLNWTGAFVASTIWPIILGLYRPHLKGGWAAAAMFLGTVSGLVAFWQVGFYVAALTSCLVSCLVCCVGLVSARDNFDWRVFQEAD